MVEHTEKLCTNIFITIFTLFTNLTHLHFNLNDNCRFVPTSFIDLPFTIRNTTSIVYLNVSVHNFDDCLCLLDGRLSQLHTFIVQVNYIEDTSIIINNTVKYFKL
ncbi:unnamed protein product [Rotaria sordida]|nr:unnamed protein product [Rotaria sordida]